MSLFISAFARLLGFAGAAVVSSGVPTNALLDPADNSPLRDPADNSYLTEP
jgi:hypothetical protein